MQKGQAGTEYSSWEPSIARTLFLGLPPLTLCTCSLRRNQVGPSRRFMGAVLLFPVEKAGVAAMVGAPGTRSPSPSVTFLLMQCKLEQQACLSSKQLMVKCEGPCPCPTEQTVTSTTDGKPGNEERRTTAR